ncbi:tyrosine-type recombinase/integrase [Streptomyces flavofungini]|uniref:tyrosine-type recombinase/integrase n=1 Tax=Streptomyces flavofungini TaxID=68200 RepID=UPI0034DEC743
MTEALAWPATPPSADAPDEELAAFMWSLIPGDYLTGVGWDPVRRVLTPPVGHPTMGSRSCPVPGCTSPVKGLKLCATCQHLHRDSGLPYEEFVLVPRTARARGAYPCSVTGCGRPRINNGKQRICRAHWYRLQVCGGTLEEFLADLAVEPLSGLGDCGVLACTREAASPVGLRLCETHHRRMVRLRRHGVVVDEQEWLRTNDAASQGTEVSFRGLPDLVAAQLLFGIYQRSMKHAKTEAGSVRALIDRTVRPSGASRLEDVPRPKANETAVVLLNRTRAFVARVLKTPETEYAKDTWDLAPFGHRGSLVFTELSQPWLLEAAKRWARDYLTRVRSRSTSSHAQQYLHGLAKLSQSLRARPDRGLDLAALSRADIENYLNRMSFLQANGHFTLNTRRHYIQKARNALREARAMGLTRPGAPMAGLPDDFVITRHDVPKAAEPSQEGQDLPPEILRQLCSHLDLFESMCCRELRVAVEILIDTGRRPDEICCLDLDCLTRDGQGKPVLLYSNWKEERIGRELPVHETTAALIRTQQDRVRSRFPGRPASKLVLLPSGQLNLHGTKSYDSNYLSAPHREWVEAMPELHLDDGTVFDKEKVFPYAYRHSYAQRHADNGVPLDVLAELLDHDSYESTRNYYRVKQVRLREAVDKVTQMQFNRHGERVWGAVTSFLDTERTRRAIGSVVVPFGTCSEPTNVAAGGGACPLRFRCVGCDHFSTDVSYLPELRSYLDDLLRTREKLLAMPEADAWARAEAAPSDEEIRRVRRLIQRVTEDVDQLTDDERDQIQQAAAIVRKTRQGFLGMPRIRQPLPDLRPERPA